MFAILYKYNTEDEVGKKGRESRSKISIIVVYGKMSELVPYSFFWNR